MDDLGIRCTTYHEACACREAVHRAEVERLRAELTTLRIDLAAALSRVNIARDERHTALQQVDAIAAWERVRTEQRDAALAEVARLRTVLVARVPDPMNAEVREAVKVARAALMKHGTAKVYSSNDDLLHRVAKVLRDEGHSCEYRAPSAVDVACLAVTLGVPA